MKTRLRSKRESNVKLEVKTNNVIPPPAKKSKARPKRGGPSQSLRVKQQSKEEGAHTEITESKDEHSDDPMITV